MFIMYKKVGIVCTEAHSPFLLKECLNSMLFLMKKTPQCSQKKLSFKLKATGF